MIELKADGKVFNQLPFQADVTIQPKAPFLSHTNITCLDKAESDVWISKGVQVVIQLKDQFCASCRRPFKIEFLVYGHAGKQQGLLALANDDFPAESDRFLEASLQPQFEVTLVAENSASDPQVGYWIIVGEADIFTVS